jgi:DNA-binding transcriptional MerR regulator
MPIGRAAEASGVTTRTLRYYEQLGLLGPARTGGGPRRYTREDLDRVARIRQLQDLLGQDLQQIAAVLAAEDRLAELRTEWQGASPLPAVRRRQIVEEAMAINTGLRQQVQERRDALARFGADLEQTAQRYREVIGELDAEETGDHAPSR